ncbi:MAG TPA: hypothetical protein VFB81_02520, partial [Myxococcales bacterium]|nr:hypothetical protein [Myxococcales bacterium]
MASASLERLQDFSTEAGSGEYGRIGSTGRLNGGDRKVSPTTTSSAVCGTRANGPLSWNSSSPSSLNAAPASIDARSALVSLISWASDRTPPSRPDVPYRRSGLRGFQEGWLKVEDLETKTLWPSSKRLNLDGWT